MSLIHLPLHLPRHRSVVRSDADIAQMRSVAERAAQIGQESDGPPDENAEGFLECLEWLAGNLDPISVLLRWAEEPGDIGR